MLTEIPVKYIRYTRSHKSGNIHGENLHRRTKKSQNIFHKKTTPQLLGQIGLQNMKVGVKANFG